MLNRMPIVYRRPLVEMLTYALVLVRKKPTCPQTYHFLRSFRLFFTSLESSSTIYPLEKISSKRFSFTFNNNQWNMMSYVWTVYRWEIWERSSRIWLFFCDNWRHSSLNDPSAKNIYLKMLYVYIINKIVL